ncbi:hypothetical protein [Winogradskyella sp. A2]|uniref:hypothetical protein n=1 Tax=Winogradskyella sp. A2 TaxID=3366944 RepID=UPI00398C461B
MGINYSKIKTSNLSIDSLLRLDSKFHLDFNDSGWDIFKTSSSNLVKLKDYIEPFYEKFNYEEDVEYFGIPTGRDYLNDFGQIISHQLVTKDDHPGRLKYSADENCILISSLKGAVTPALNFDFNLSKYVFSNGFYIFKPKGKNNKKFILYLLRSIRIKYLIDNVIYRGIGISSYREDDLLNIQIPYIDSEKQNSIVKKIEPLENEIIELINSKKSEIDIINEAFSNEFNFDFEVFNKLKSEKIVSSSLLNFSNNIDCRFGYRFQHKSGKYMMDFLKSKTQKRIKDYVAIPITLGKSVSPSQYDEEGEYYYISMATVKKFYFDKEDAKKVSDEYSNQNLNKAVKKNDIIMTRSGMAIGKFALIKKNIKGIYADFTMRIRLENYNHQLAYYYFRSVFFQQLITTNKKGLQNHNIFPSMIQEFPIPDWSIEKQNEICDSITKQIDKQRDIDKIIEQKQNEINRIIENAIESE